MSITQPPGCGFERFRRPLTTVTFQSSAMSPFGSLTLTAIAFASSAVRSPAAHTS